MRSDYPSNQTPKHPPESSPSRPLPPASKPFTLPQIEEKRNFLSRCIDEVETQIADRIKKKEEYCNDLLQQTCDIRNTVNALPNDSPLRVKMDQEIRAIEQQRHQQELACWRDVSERLTELRQLRSEYRAVEVSLHWMCPKN